MFYTGLEMGKPIKIRDLRCLKIKVFKTGIMFTKCSPLSN